jgi:hypothetical protein
MPKQDYNKVLAESIIKIGKLAGQRDELEIQIGKLRQFIYATLNMLTDEERKTFDDAVRAVGEMFDAKSASLVEAIRKALQDSPKKWFTAAEVRNRVVVTGFDFSLYTSNPLSSVATTLKRLKRQEVETSEIEGVAVYRWKERKSLGSPTGTIPLSNLSGIKIATAIKNIEQALSKKK